MRHRAVVLVVSFSILLGVGAVASADNCRHCPGCFLGPGGWTYCAPGPPCITGVPKCDSLAPSIPTMVIAQDVIDDIAATHPRVGMVLMALNREGGIRWENMEVHDLALPFSKADFDKYASNVEESRAERTARAAGSDETVDYAITVRVADGKPVAIELRAVKPFPDDRAFSAIEVPVSVDQFATRDRHIVIGDGWREL